MKPSGPLMLALAAILPLGCATMPPDDDDVISTQEQQAILSERFERVPMRWDEVLIQGDYRQVYYTEDEGSPFLFWIDEQGKLRPIEP